MERKVIIENGTSEIEVKKSRFLGEAHFVESEEQAAEIVNSIRKEHYSARHVCYAYSIGDKNPRLKFSDDGEPGGTAGKPILDVITGSGIENILVTVVRYFGGTLLGTGGLVRAYSEAASEAVKAAGVKTVALCCIYEISLEYSDYDKVRFLLESKEGVLQETEYQAAVVITTTIPEVIAEETVREITEKTAGRAELRLIDKRVV